MQKAWYKKKSSLHGSGLFALSNIKKNDQVIQYIGDKVTKKEGDRRADIQLKKGEKINGMDGPDIILNHNFVACRRPKYDFENTHSSDNYFKEVEEADDGSHRREGILLVDNSKFIQHEKVVDHTEFPSLIFNLFGLKIPTELRTSGNSFDELSIIKKE